jgi:hypothetical protein
MKSAFDGWNWQPPSHWPRIETIDMHTGGEPLRIYVSGLPPIEGNTVLEKRRYFRENHTPTVRDGRPLFELTIPAGGSATIRYQTEHTSLRPTRR